MFNQASRRDGSDWIQAELRSATPRLLGESWAASKSAVGLHFHAQRRARSLAHWPKTILLAQAASSQLMLPGEGYDHAAMRCPLIDTSVLALQCDRYFARADLETVITNDDREHLLLQPQRFRQKDRPAGAFNTAHSLPALFFCRRPLVCPCSEGLSPQLQGGAAHQR